eukprot:GEMP01039762.1.p1 GENE.GEMP01039762.1~~GEMP01039762.1.p1  ORF type:complete len:123 (+),score=18.37 GEMP01039762.1:391-759(+)
MPPTRQERSTLHIGFAKMVDAIGGTLKQTRCEENGARWNIVRSRLKSSTNSTSRACCNNHGDTVEMLREESLQNAARGLYMGDIRDDFPIEVTKTMGLPGEPMGAAEELTTGYILLCLLGIW